MARVKEASNRFPKDLGGMAQKVLGEWSRDKFSVRDLTPKSYGEQAQKFAESAGRVAELEVKLAQARDERDEQGNRLWDVTRRIRNAAKAYFGDDSDDMARYGVEPMKSRGRRKPAAPQA